MTILHSGTTKTYSNNWAKAFGQPVKKSDGGKKKSTKPAAKKRSTKKNK